MRFVQRSKSMISGLLRLRLEVPQPGSLPAILALSLLTVLISGCPSRKEVDAELWNNTGIPAEECAKNENLKKYGFYRLLDSGKYEFLSYCKEIQDTNGKPVLAAQRYTSINTLKLNGFLKELLPKADDVKGNSP